MLREIVSHKVFKGFDNNHLEGNSSEVTLKMYSNVIDKIVTIIVICVIFAALVPTILSAFTQLSTSGIVLATLFSTVLGIVFAVFVLKTIMKHLS